MPGIRQNSENIKVGENRKNVHEQIDVLLSKLRRFKLLRDAHILKIIQLKTHLVGTNKERKKKEIS